VAQGHPSGHSGAQGPPTDSWGASEDTFLSGVVATLVLGPEELGREETPPTWWAQGHGDTEWTRGSVSVPVPLGRATRGAAASQDSARQDLEGRNGSVARVAPAARAREPRSPSRTRRSPRTAPEPTCRSRCQSVGAPGGGGLAPEVTRSLPAAAAAAAAMAHITINQYLQQVGAAASPCPGGPAGQGPGGFARRVQPRAAGPGFGRQRCGGGRRGRDGEREAGARPPVSVSHTECLWGAGLIRQANGKSTTAVFVLLYLFSFPVLGIACQASPLPLEPRTPPALLFVYCFLDKALLTAWTRSVGPPAFASFVAGFTGVNRRARRSKTSVPSTKLCEGASW
jgi:hypothetical protein